MATVIVKERFASSQPTKNRHIAFSPNVLGKGSSGRVCHLIALAVAALASALVASAGPASAFSGSEFLSATRDMGDGYAWGVVDSRIVIMWSQDPEYIREMRAVWQCLADANVNSTTFGDAVRTVIRNDPAFLTQPAIGAIMKTLTTMCPT